MCWQGSKLSGYIQGVNEHMKYTQKYTLLQWAVTYCYMLSGPEQKRHLSFGALVLELHPSSLSLGWLNNTLGSFSYTRRLVVHLTVIVCLPSCYIKIRNTVQTMKVCTHWSDCFWFWGTHRFVNCWVILLDKSNLFITTGKQTFCIWKPPGSFRYNR